MAEHMGDLYCSACTPRPWLILDADLAWSNAHFTDPDPVGDYIPGSVATVVAAGMTVDSVRHVFGSVRWRYFGPRPLIEDNAVQSRATTLVNLEGGYKLSKSVRVLVDRLLLPVAAAIGTVGRRQRHSSASDIAAHGAHQSDAWILTLRILETSTWETVANSCVTLAQQCEAASGGFGGLSGAGWSSSCHRSCPFRSSFARLPTLSGPRSARALTKTARSVRCTTPRSRRNRSRPRVPAVAAPIRCPPSRHRSSGRRPS